jgi:hypothetical protein
MYRCAPSHIKIAFKLRKHKRRLIVLHNLLHGLLRSAEMGLHRSSLFHENKNGATLGGLSGVVAGLALATTPVGLGIAMIIGMGGGALVEKGVKGSISSKSK